MAVSPQSFEHQRAEQTPERRGAEPNGEHHDPEHRGAEPGAEQTSGHSTAAEPPYPLRLQKFLARAGAASRRGCEDLMTAGRVSVNGVVVTTLGTKVDPTRDEVRLDGRLITLADSHTTLMLNKPTGYLTTMDDPQGRPTVRELVPTEAHPGLFPVGRLDNDTTGLLLFTTDGEMAHQLLHPRHHVLKRYRATVDGVVTADEARQLSEGVLLSDGPTAPALVELGAVQPKALTPRERLRLPKDAGFQTHTMTLWLSITEGRKRQVRRMCSHLGHEVLSLTREAFGPLTLGTLRGGEWRYLTDEETEALKQASSKSPTA